MSKKQKSDKVLCPICGQRKVGEYDICEICNWEYDSTDAKYPDENGGCNHISLNEGKIWFAKYGKTWQTVWEDKLAKHYNCSIYDGAVFTKNQHEYLPLPQNQISASNGKYQQNCGIW